MSIVATLANNGALETVIMKKAVPLAYAALCHHRFLTNRRPYGSRSISTVSQPRLMPNQSPSTVKQLYSPISPPCAAFRNTVVSRQYSTESIDSIDPDRFKRRRGFNVGIRFVPQQEALVIERFGKFTKILEPGLHFLTPLVEKIAYKHSLKEQMIVMQEHPAVTTDNVSIRVNAVLFVKVVDPYKASYGNDNVMYAVTQLAQTVMRSTIGKMQLDKTFMERENLNTAVNAINDVATQSEWGVVCCRHEIKDIIAPPGVKESMIMQAESERKKRAEVIEADGAKQAEIKRSEARMTAQINQAQGERQAQIYASEAAEISFINRSRGERQAQIYASEAAEISFINRARGEAEAKRIIARAEADAILILSEAAKIDSINRETGKAEALRIIANSMQANGGLEAVKFKVAQDYVQAFNNIAKESTTMLLPAAVSDPSSMIASALALYKNVIVDKQHVNNNLQDDKQDGNNNLQDDKQDGNNNLQDETSTLIVDKQHVNNNLQDDKQHGNNNLQDETTSTLIVDKHVNNNLQDETSTLIVDKQHVNNNLQDDGNNNLQDETSTLVDSACNKD